MRNTSRLKYHVAGPIGGRSCFGSQKISYFCRSSDIRGQGEAALAVVQDALGEPNGVLCSACPVVLSELLVGQVAASFALRYRRVLAVARMAALAGLAMARLPRPICHADIAARSRWKRFVRSWMRAERGPHDYSP